MTTPHLRSTASALVLACAFALTACGKLKPSGGADAAVDQVDGPPRDGDGDVPSRDAAAPEGGDASEAGVDAPFVSPPGTRRLVSGPASLVGAGADSCTNDPSATGDRWCGFVVPTPGSAPAALWVFDATRAAAGDDVRCDGTDARCLELTVAALYNGFMSGTSYGFQGDTLFYRAGDGTTAADQLGGPVFAWRPGWTAGRELVTGSSTTCAAPAMRAVALCLRQTEDATSHDISEELTRGALSDPTPPSPADAAPLALLDHVLVRSGATQADVATLSEIGFSPDGATIAWSFADAVTGIETLREAPLTGTAGPTTVASGVTSWRISGDGASWLWLRSYTDDGLAPSGTLAASDFPVSADATTVATDVGDFDVVGDRGVLYRAHVADQVGELRFLPDRTAPATSSLLDDDVRLVVARSADASTVVYTRTSTAVGDDLFLWSAGLAAPCTLTSIPSALRAATLMAGGRVVVWANRDIRSQVLSGAATTIASCATQTFGLDLLQATAASDDHLLYIDGAANGATAGTLRATSVTVAGVSTPGTPLARNVDAVFAPLAGAAVVYTSSQGAVGDAPGAAGLYVYAGPLLGP
ncbi:MAG TPA: hypothetical protein VLA14_01445 [Polyangia bacterium]|nr:hypothetical protein [Polyangia bacterium]